MVDRPRPAAVEDPPIVFISRQERGGEELGSVIKKRRKKMRKHKHKKLLARTRHQRRSK